MILTANRQLSGDYGHVRPGETFKVRDDIGKDLLSRKLAHEVKVVIPETKRSHKK